MCSAGSTQHGNVDRESTCNMHPKYSTLAVMWTGNVDPSTLHIMQLDLEFEQHWPSSVFLILLHRFAPYINHPHEVHRDHRTGNCEQKIHFIFMCPRNAPFSAVHVHREYHRAESEDEHHHHLPCDQTRIAPLPNAHPRDRSLQQPGGSPRTIDLLYGLEIPANHGIRDP